MRELHAIGLTPDGQHLLLAATPDATKPSHRIVVDKRFEAALRGRSLDDPASGPALSVGDMQARLRAGASVDEVAAAAGVPVSRVARFAGPILSEREEVLRKVFDAHQVGRRGRSTVALGRAVDIAMADVANARLDTVEWTAYKKTNGVWVAAVSVQARGRLRRAEWSLDDADRSVKPLDPWASSLGHVEALTKPAASKAPRVKQPASARTTVATRQATPVAKPAPAKVAAANVAAAKATPARAAAAKATPAKVAAAKATPAKAAAAKAAPAKQTAATKAPAAAVAPPRRAARQAGGARRSGS